MRLAAAFDQTVDPDAVFKIDGTCVARTTRQDMNVMTALRQPSSQVARQAPDATDYPGRILLAQQTDSELFGWRQERWATLEYALT